MNASPPGDLDLYLLGEGRHRRLWEVLGGRLLPDGGARFAVWAPNARSVPVSMENVWLISGMHIIFFSRAVYSWSILLSAYSHRLAVHTGRVKNTCNTRFTAPCTIL